MHAKREKVALVGAIEAATKDDVMNGSSLSISRASAPLFPTATLDI